MGKAPPPPITTSWCGGSGRLGPARGQPRAWEIRLRAGPAAAAAPSPAPRSCKTPGEQRLEPAPQLGRPHDSVLIADKHPKGFFYPIFSPLELFGGSDPLGAVLGWQGSA